ncbi:MAG TPA: glycoside hydrolase family 127 protein [Rhizomicrobium sp.]
MALASFSRRVLLSGTASLGLMAVVSRPGQAASASDFPAAAKSFPLDRVRLLPSPYREAVQSNLIYLHRLEPDRLLHNFRTSAGLAPKAAVYGGWESETIAGHTLGHYLSACSLMFAQTDDAECRRRVGYIVDELAACQDAEGDGYVAGFTRKRGDTIEDGKVIFAEIRHGDIRARPFDLNGAWSPLYNVHKTFAGLLDAHLYCDSAKAIVVAEKFGEFLDAVFATLNEAQVQEVLACEHGGLNESFAELYARTGNRRWRDLGARIYHRKVLDPLTAGRDELDGLHSNCQIPKLIGLARLHEVTGEAGYAAAAQFFWSAVTSAHSYVIGGNGDREYFQTPNSIADYLTEQTCESCCSYNMLKLTRHLYQWNPDAALFDYYERAHLNHILAQHNPRTQMFTYMMPMTSGTHREFSTPFGDFWCCMGTGMESHSKHGDSIYWHAEDRLFVNLFIPSRLDWREKGIALELLTGYPFAENIILRVAAARRPVRFTMALRIPGWCENPGLRVNGASVRVERRNGYALVQHRWRVGDVVELFLPQKLRMETAAGNAGVIAFLQGPTVLAANLGSAFNGGPAPAIVAADPLENMQADPVQPAVYRTAGTGRPGDVTLEPFFRQYDNNTAIYFQRFTGAEWEAHQTQLAEEAAALKALNARSIDILQLGDEADEKTHALESKDSYALVYRGRKGRDARSGGYVSFRMKSSQKPLVLRATYSGDDRDRIFRILIDGAPVATERLNAEKRGGFIDRDYDIPATLTAGKRAITVRFEPETGHSAGPMFGCRLLAGA